MRRLAVAVLALVVLAACNQSRRKTVAVIPKATSHIFWVSVEAGARAAGQEFGLDVDWNGPAVETDIARQIQIVDSMIARRVDGIVLAACDRQALIKPVDRAVAGGIPVTIFDSGLDSTNYLSYVATDNKEAGRMGARALARLLNGNGRIGVIRHVAGSVSTTEREDGFTEVIRAQFPGIQIVQELFGQADPAKSRSAAENILTAHPDLDGFFASTEPSSTGTILALKSRGLSGKVKLVCFDSNEAMVEDLKGGTLQAMVVQDPFKIGYEAVKTIADQLATRPVPKRTDLPAVVVTMENLNDTPIQSLLKPDLKKYLKQ